MDPRSTILTLRIIACMVVAAALAGFFTSLRFLPNQDATFVFVSLGLLAMSGGIGAILFGLAAILHQRANAPSSEASSAALAQNQLIALSLKMEDLAAAVERLSRQRDASPVPASHSPSGGASPDVLQALQRLFEELRDVSLLTDEQRRERSNEMKEQAKAAAIQTAIQLIQERRWIDAQNAVSALEKACPGDAALIPIRQQMQTAHASAAAEAIHIAEAQIESEMSRSHWDQAAALARKLVHDVPTNQRAAAVLARVEREKGIYTEATVNRLYEEIRHDVERRIWRRALSHAQQLLEKFPDHPRSELIRKQVKTIQDNAEIEERQEQEAHIGELIRSRRFREAADLSKELLRCFPNSPQADAIQKMLPRIQQLAAEAEEQTAHSSSV
jgi:outer membrane protein assembly factor BamD (BamD/ComL family)